MAYFPAAYKKVFLARGGHNSALPLEQLSEWMFGFFDAKTWAPVDTAHATMGEHPQVVLAVGNPYHTVGADKQGPHGGYTESMKSQVIDPRYISRFWKVKPRSARPHSVFLGWDTMDYNLTPPFYCGRIYNLRLDVKGSKALRFVGHNLYRSFSVSTGCCTNISDPERMEPVLVLLEFARQIQEDPLLSPFVTAQVVTEDWDTGNLTVVDPATYVPRTLPDEIVFVPAGLQLILLSSETEFGFCSFDPTDHYEIEPLVLTSAQWVNDDGAICPDFQPLAFTVQSEPLTPEGTPDQVLRDLLMSISYRQEIYPKDVRMRVVKDLQKVVGDTKSVYRYLSYYILHSVPRRYNPTGIYDNDQYLIQIVFLGDDMTSATYLEAWMASYLASAGNGVVLEDLSGVLDGV